MKLDYASESTCYPGITPAASVVLFLLSHRQIHHPNILTFLGVIIKETAVTILCNLVKGHDLHALIFDPNHQEV